MKAKTIKKIHKFKKGLLKKWYFCMKPLANAIITADNKKSTKKYDKLANMTFEEVAKLYVKYTVKYMTRRKDSKEFYYCCTKKDGCFEYFEDNFILSDLSRLGYSRFNRTKIHNWFYTNKECNSIKYGEEGNVKWIELENRLRGLVEVEFIRAGCKVEYIDETDILDNWFVKFSGYEKTMVVSI